MGRKISDKKISAGQYKTSIPITFKKNQDPDYLNHITVKP